MAWNQEDGWIACGGRKGLLKVIKLDPPVQPEPGQPPQSNLSENQALEGHHANLTCVAWNEPYRKLTSADESGLIIVWINQRSVWQEEMINHHNKSLVTDMKWSNDGQKIGIIYQDGNVIVGSVEGNRVWGKLLPHNLSHLEWAPDSKTLLFSSQEGEVRLYDNAGNSLSYIEISCLRGVSGMTDIATIAWFSGSGYVGHGSDVLSNPSLAVVYRNGRMQLMRSETDKSPVIVDTQMEVSIASWNPLGAVIAVAGHVGGVGTVNFYTNQGIHMRTLTLPENAKVSSFSWEGSGLRVTMSVENIIYFASIKPDHKWTYFSNSLVFASQKPDHSEFSIVFWNTSTDEKYYRIIKKLISIAGSTEHCVLASQAEDEAGQYNLVLCNAIGSPVDSKSLHFEPLYLAMNGLHVIACSEDCVYVWQYRSQVSRFLSLDAAKSRVGREVAFGIEQTPNFSEVYDSKRFSKTGRTSNIITCLTIGQGFFMVGRANGLIMKYSLPQVALETQYLVRCQPQLIKANLDSTYLSVVDIGGVLSFFDTQQNVALELVRKDVWDVQWSSDSAKSVAIMEKSRMFVLNDFQPEEPNISSAYLCQFKDLEVKAVLLDDLMLSAEPPSLAQKLLLTFQTDLLRNTIVMINSKDIQEAFEDVKATPHKRLWRLVAETALRKMSFDVAQKAFVKVDDYQGICFVKKVKKLDNDRKRQAEVALYFKEFDDAEKIYRELDRKDLALEMRMMIGDWFDVIKLVQQGVGHDELLNLAYNSLGEYYSERFRWSKAAVHYALAQNVEALVEAYYRTEDFEGLSRLTESLPAESPLLFDIAEKFQSVGLCEAAVTAYLKAGDVRKGVDCCVLLNQWNQAVTLAEQHNFVQIEGLLSRYASHLLDENRRVEAIELYRKANRNTEAAKLLNKIAKDMSRSEIDPILIKKIYVMAALEVDSYKRRMIDAQLTGTGSTTQTLESLITSDINTMSDKTLDNPWRGAEAFHFFLMAQRQLYQGQYDYALRTSLRLCEYENILDTKEIYSLIALSAFYARSLKECSRALVKLENLPNLTEEQREAYEGLSVSIFSKYPPRDRGNQSINCPNKSCSAKVSAIATNCGACGSNFPGCIASGRPIHEKIYVQCKSCKHKAIEEELVRMRAQNCPLCHATLKTISSK
jgi:WD repeat-containing protein 35